MLQSPLTRQFAHWSHQCRFEDLSHQALEIAHLGFVDCLGVMLAGANEPVLKALRHWAHLQGGRARALRRPSQSIACKYSRTDQCHSSPCTGF